MPRALQSAGLAILAFFACVGAVAQAQTPSVADFYKGKQIDFFIAGAPGEIYDQWARLMAQYLGRHIPGNPTILVRNMPGGGDLVATNYLYNIAPRDGSVIGMVSRNMPTQDVLKVPQVKFKSLEFNWLGSPEFSNRVCVASSKAKVKTADDLFQNELIVGGTGGGSAVSTTPVLLNKVLGMKLKAIAGYHGGGDIFLAIDRGEVEGVCMTIAAINASAPGWIEQGRVKILFNLEKDPIPGSGAPSVQSMAKTDEQRQIIAFYNSNIELGRPVLTTPGVPADRVAALRHAFDAMMQDTDFLAMARTTHFQINPLTGEQVSAGVARIMQTPKDIIDKTIAIVGTLGD